MYEGLFHSAHCTTYFSCKSNPQSVDHTTNAQHDKQTEIVAAKIIDSSSWQYFLQHLPEKSGTIVNYKGQPVSNQEKHFSIINYDVGNRDLQQCADALMRLRAEYLFGQKRFNEIGFHFVSGDYYSFTAYCNGKVPVAKGSGVVFISSTQKKKTRPHCAIILTLFILTQALFLWQKN